MTAPAVYKRADLMVLLGYKDRDCFRARLRVLTAGDFFPPPLFTRPERWSRHQVDAWLAGIRPKTAMAASHVAAPSTPTPTTLPTPATPLQAALMAKRFVVLQGGLASSSN